MHDPERIFYGKAEFASTYESAEYVYESLGNLYNNGDIPDNKWSNFFKRAVKACIELHPSQESILNKIKFLFDNDGARQAF